MAQQPIRDLLTKEKSTAADISRFACGRGHVDLCSRLLEKEDLRRKTEKQLAAALKNMDKYREYFQTLLSTVKSILDPHSIVLNIFKSQLAKISEVKARYFAKTPKALTVWLFIEEDNWGAEENIYEAYGEMLDLFPDTEINLRLLKLFGRKPEELMPRGFKQW